MKLLVFNEISARGGGSKYMIDCINAVGRAYNEVVILSNLVSLYPEDQERLCFDVGLKKTFFLSHHLLSKFLCRLYYKGQFIFDPIILVFNIIIFMYKVCQEKPTHILVSNGGYPASLASLSMVISAKILKVPVILSIVSMPAPRRYFYEKHIDALLVNACTSIIVNAHAIANALNTLRSFPLDKIDIVINGIKKNTCIGTQINPNGDLLIGCIMRLDEEKGALVLLDAFSELSKKYQSIKLCLVGSGNASEKIKKRLGERFLLEKVQLLGHYDGDVLNVINTFDIYAFPSFWEGLPYSLIEALSAGRAIVSTNVGGISEIIDDGINGFLVEPRSVVQLMRSIEKLIIDHDLRSRFSKNARDRFEKQLTLGNMHKQCKAVFQKRLGIHL